MAAISEAGTGNKKREFFAIQIFMPVLPAE
jgi:hypothetical protein